MWDKETDKEVVRAHEIRFHRNRNKETGRDLNENFSTNVDNVEHGLNETLKISRHS